MARRSKKSYTRSFARGARRSFRRASAMSGGMGGDISAGIYGAVRAKVAEWVTPFSNMLPLGNMSDEVVLYIANRFVEKRVPALRGVAHNGRIVEAARIGELLMTQGLSFGGGQSSTNSGKLF